MIGSFRIVHRKGSRVSAKTIGNSGQPCLISFLTRNGVDSSPFTLILAEGWEYRLPIHYSIGLADLSFVVLPPCKPN